MRSSGAVLTLLLAAWGTSAAEPDQSDSYFPIWGEELAPGDIPFRYLTASI